MPTEPQKYHVYLDYEGFMLEPGSYRSAPAPLFGTQFASGRPSYSTLDFWQVGGMTDFSKGINQWFLADPSQFYYSEGIDCMRPGEIKLERDLEDQSMPSGFSETITARYRASDMLLLGGDGGTILKSIDGLTFTKVSELGKKIYGFYEMKDTTETGTPKYYFATRGSEYALRSQDGTTWEVCDGTSSKPSIKDLYFVMIESDYAYGVFDDGVRQCVDGRNFTPAPPDPLWSLPASEGIALNALPIARGFLIGAKRGLWIFTGGGSGIVLWHLPDFASSNNFKGMDRFLHYGIFSVEGMGIFFTDGAAIHPTQMNWQEVAFPAKYTKDILVSGWDVFAIVSTDYSNWYLARSSMMNAKTPKYWWIVKALDNTAQKLSAWSDDKIFIHYSDGSCKSYNKNGGPYQTSGYLETSLSDENLVLLQKLYHTVSATLRDFPNYTSVDLAYRLDKASGSYTTESFSGDGSTSIDSSLTNPTLGQRLQVKITLHGDTTTPDTSVSPIVTDLFWKYILERPTSEGDRKKIFTFMVLAEDQLEKLDFDVEEMGENEPRSRQDILDQIWTIRNEKQILNFVGADNVNKNAFTIEYTGSASSCLMTIDRTNYTLSTNLGLSINYEDKNLSQVVDLINAESDYTATIDPAEKGTSTSANDLFPIKEVEIKGVEQVYYGTDVHAVLMNSQSPMIYKKDIEGRGSDRIQISLREV